MQSRRTYLLQGDPRRGSGEDSSGPGLDLLALAFVPLADGPQPRLTSLRSPSVAQSAFVVKPMLLHLARPAETPDILSMTVRAALRLPGEREQVRDW